MPISKPIQTTISTSDFRNKAYTFSIESVLTTNVAPGWLVVSASAGYLLTTSLTNQVGREHTFEYKQQANGSWLANGTVTVMSRDDQSADGKIVIQNSVDESVILTIAATSTAVERSKTAALMGDQPTLTFAPTPSGKPSFLIVTITPQQAGETVTLTTDAPDVFQIASDSRPKFGSALTFTPSTTGTYVHVRYVSSKPGTHSGQLLLQSDSETRSVTLTARTTGLLPGMLQRPNQSALKRLWVGLGSLVLVGSLALAGYSKRCQYFPSLCQEVAINQERVKTPDWQLSPTKVAAASGNSLSKPARVQKKSKKAAPTETRSSSNRAEADELMVTTSSEQQAVVDSREVKKPVSTSDKDGSKPVVVQSNRQTTIPSNQESELERVLNSPSFN
ncbi:hypothetical protein IC229_12265 [Spirosoma sp. BT702]|uniref:BACON domain-containing protein n=1 Tax=Spirosoma profusum TaxID=2771354 RepID=A0A926Y028_9BACT|nr:hypothetical protein [Spirosoma profusum]MBD2701417.1 hypothetical protein [Spirosoma profusum]